MTKRNDSIALAGRILLGVLFLMSGLGKLAAPAATQGYIAAAGLPLPLVAYLGSMSVEIIGGLFLLTGLQTRRAAAVLAVFTLLAAVFFHNNFADQNQAIHFMKNIAIIGGLLQVLAFGAGSLSLDRRFTRSAASPAHPVSVA